MGGEVTALFMSIYLWVYLYQMNLCALHSLTLIPFLHASVDMRNICWDLNTNQLGEERPRHVRRQKAGFVR